MTTKQDLNALAREGGFSVRSLSQSGLRGFPLWELVRARAHPSYSAPAGVVEQRWRSLQDELGEGLESSITSRLDALGIPRQTFNTIFDGQHQPPREDQLGDWNLLDLTPLLDAPPFSPAALDSAAPFSDILFPLVQRTQRRFLTSLSTVEKRLLSQQALSDLTTYLLNELSAISTDALMLEFHLYQRRQSNSGLVLFSKLTRTKDVSIYQDFCDSLRTDGGYSFYQRYPVIPRLFLLRCQTWITNSTDLIRAYRRDRKKITCTLSLPPPGGIAAIDCGLSDPHHGHKGVHILTLESGAKIVYKPRSLSLDMGFMRILTHLNAAHGSQLFRVIKMTGGRNHSWCEYIDHSTTDDPQELETYHYRVGALLAVLHAFMATDCHSENIIASGNFPVLVDMETLFHPTYQHGDLPSETARDSNALAGAVTRIGILPDGKASQQDFDASPYGVVRGPQSINIRTIQNRGTVLMGPVDKEIAPNLMGSTPSTSKLEDQIVTNQLTRGFEQSYRLILRERDNILTLPHLLPSLRHASVRFVVRPTAAYVWLHRRALKANCLQDGITRSIVFERLFRKGANKPVTHDWNRIAERERESLEKLDVPYFSVRLNGCSLLSENQVIAPRYLVQSPFSVVRERLSLLSPADCRNQQAIIKLAFARRVQPTARTMPPDDRGRPVHTDQDRIIKTAREVYAHIEEAAMESSQSHSEWLGVTANEETNTITIESAGLGLYRGAAGIAIFFSALYAVTEDLRIKRRSLSLLNTIRKRVKLRTRGETPVINLGEGLAGFVYASHHCGKLLNEDSLCTDAHSFSRAITKQALINEPNLDVIGGVAGTALALQVLHQERPSKELESKLRIVADRLVAAAQASGPESCGWDTWKGSMLPGFAHGSAGIAYALARLATSLREPSYLETAMRGLRHERTVYRDELKTWQDLRMLPKVTPTTASWCHGAVGIALSYLAYQDPPANAAAEALSRAAIVVRRSLLLDEGADNICCGYAGILELTMRLASDTSWRELHAECLRRLVSSGSHRYMPLNSHEDFIANLFGGAAGIGYQLLRTVEPDRIPALLLFN